MGNNWRDDDPWTSRKAGERDFKNQQETTLYISGQISEPFTWGDIQRAAEEKAVREFFGSPRPVGTCPWKRLQECKELGWVKVVLDNNNVPVARMEMYGQPQQVYQITPRGNLKIWEIGQRLTDDAGE